LVKVSAGGANVVIAAAVMAPIPGIVISRAMVSSLEARARSSFSGTPISSLNVMICFTNMAASFTTGPGSTPLSPSITAIKRPMWTEPAGATTPYSAR